jgi:hypothetical protein
MVNNICIICYMQTCETLEKNEVVEYGNNR